MNTYLTATIATERQHQFIADAEQHRRTRTTRTRTTRTARPAEARRTRSHRVTGFLRDLAAASL